MAIWIQGCKSLYAQSLIQTVPTINVQKTFIELNLTNFGSARPFGFVNLTITFNLFLVRKYVLSSKNLLQMNFGTQSVCKSEDCLLCKNTYDNCLSSQFFSCSILWLNNLDYCELFPLLLLGLQGVSNIF